jgi:hypothetical protein
VTQDTAAEETKKRRRPRRKRRPRPEVIAGLRAPGEGDAEGDVEAGDEGDSEEA